MQTFFVILQTIPRSKAQDMRDICTPKTLFNLALGSSVNLPPHEDFVTSPKDSVHMQARQPD